MAYRMLESTQIGLGYDEFGNCARLVAECDREALLRVSRAAGDAECTVCGQLLRHHPAVQGALWATRGCKEIVKL